MRPPIDPVAAPLDMRGIGFSIAGHQILRGVSLTVQPPEVVCLLGQSGCGKTTLLRIAAGIEQQTTGTVSVGGEVAADPTRFVPAEHRPVGLVFQDLALFPHLRVADNICYGLRSAARRRADVETVLDQVGLAGFGKKYPHQLSGGEQQRVALLRALMPDPAVLLLDEPFSGLDLNLRDAVRDDVMRVLRGRGTTAVMVTHDPQEALVTADRIALMRRGELVQTATPQEIWDSPVDLEAARMFGPVSAFDAPVSAGAVVTPFGSIPASGLPDGTRASIGFRPEALGLHATADSDRPRGNVVGRRFLGSVVEYAIALSASDSICTVRVPPSQAKHADEVFVSADPAQAMIFASE